MIQLIFIFLFLFIVIVMIFNGVQVSVEFLSLALENRQTNVGEFQFLVERFG